MKRSRYCKLAAWLFALVFILAHTGTAFAESVKLDKLIWAT
jgi:hypothetical protein